VDDEVGAPDAERVEERIERAGVEVVVVRDVEGLIGEAVAREVERDRAVGLAKLGEDVAVEVRRGCKAVEDEDGVAVWIGGACFEVVEVEGVCGEVVGGGLGHRALIPASLATVTEAIDDPATDVRCRFRSTVC
jgi:hypothetical protein